MDELDRKLLAALAKDARAPAAALARRLGTARTTVQARLERLETTGVIAGYTVRLGEAALARRIRATVLVGVEPKALAQVMPKLQAMPAIEVAHTTSGRFDLCLQVAASSTAELDAALDAIGRIPGVEDTESLVHLSTRIDRAL